MVQIIGRRYDTQKVVALHCVEGRVAEIEHVHVDVVDSAQEIPWLGPGLVDLQVNGFGGQEFTDPDLTIEHVEEISLRMDADGVTHYLPTLTTNSIATLTHALSTISSACSSSPEVAARVPGIHLEGPYLSPHEGPRGAHPQRHCRAPDWDEFSRLQEAAEGRIRILTLSPEYDGTADFIARTVESGVVVAIGHTSADSSQIRAAVDAGASMSTHLGNGAHGQIRRHPNYIWDQLAEDRLVASLIVDGHHLPAAVVKSFVRGKTTDRCVLVSDMVGMAGMPPGRYENSAVGDIEILDDGRIVVAGQRQYLAGASLPLTVGVANIMRFTEMDLATAIDLASRRPAQLIAAPAGAFEVGVPADFIQFAVPTSGKNRIQILATIKAAKPVYGDLWTPAI
ncbi:MAG: N-acetylglucosamine-6-phosphate deacetylase [Planctomycetaceae bacterium]|nr:N-acetylglucosamine-6-phosphate deacetylase [Planctomycetaceae bacterium]